MIEQDQFFHGGIMWRYQDARGIEHLGHFVHCSDFGGSDVSYHFRDCETGELSIVRGLLFKHANASQDCCDTRRALLAQCA
jgi:hypothetical protein